MADEVVEKAPGSPFKSLVDSFNSLDKFLKIQVLTIALIVVATPMIVGSYLVFRPTAQELNPEQEVTGTLEVAHGDNFDNNTASFAYDVKTDSGKKVKIKNINKDKALKNAGARVRIKGKKVRVNPKQDDANVLGDSTSSAQSNSSPTPETSQDQVALDVLPVTDPNVALDTSSVETLAPAAPAPIQKKIAFILINFTNNTIQPLTQAQASSVLLTSTSSVKNFFEEESRGAIQFSADVYGYYTIPTTNAGCDWTNWGNLADAAATRAGVNLSSYTNVVYFWPQATSCGWAGLGYVSGPKSYQNGAGNLRVISHELGHNFGIMHASSLSCTDSSGARVAMSNNCSYSEYGDPLTVMGSSTSNHNNEPHIGQLGWLQPGEVQKITSSGTYQLNSLLNSPAGNTKAIQIPTVSSRQRYIYLDYRIPFGPYFDCFGVCSSVQGGLMVHTSNDDIAPGYPENTMLIDTTPSTNSFYDAQLGVGKSVYDPGSKITITNLSTTTNSVQVKIDFATSPPTGTPTPTNGPSTPTPTLRPTNTPTPTFIPTSTPTPTIKPTNTPTPTVGPTRPPGKISFVKTIGSISVSRSGNSKMIIPATAVAKGDRVIVSAQVGTFNGIITCNDSKGNSYTLDGRGGSNSLFVCSANVVNPLTTNDTITLTYPGFSGTSTAVASEFSGITSVDSSYKIGSSTSTRTVYTSNFTTTSSADLLFGLVGSKYSFSPSNGFSLITSFNGLSTTYRTTSSLGIFSTLGSVSQGSWGAVMVGYK